MLKNLDPLLHADILHTLRAMGHGTKSRSAMQTSRRNPSRSTVVGRALRIDGADSARVVRAVLSVLRSRHVRRHPAWRMEVVGDAAAVPPVQREVCRDRPRGRARGAACGHRPVRVLRARAAGLRGDRHRRAARLRLLHLQEGRVVERRGLNAFSSAAFGPRGRRRVKICLTFFLDTAETLSMLAHLPPQCCRAAPNARAGGRIAYEREA